METRWEMNASAGAGHQRAGKGTVYTIQTNAAALQAKQAERQQYKKTGDKDLWALQVKISLQIWTKNIPPATRSI